MCWWRGFNLFNPNYALEVLKERTSALVGLNPRLRIQKTSKISICLLMRDRGLNLKMGEG
jgi:hypothetical protein